MYLRFGSMVVIYSQRRGSRRLRDGGRITGSLPLPITRPEDAVQRESYKTKLRSDLWEHLGRKIQPVTPSHICISQACVYSDAQFIPPVLINRGRRGTVGGRGEEMRG